MIRIIIALFFVVLSCKNTKEIDFATVSGKIENPIFNTSVFIRSNQIDWIYKKSNYDKIINVDDKGNFHDTLLIKEGNYDFFYNGIRFSIYLKQGYNLKVNFDSENIVKSLTYKGEGYELNQFDADKQRLRNSIYEEYSQRNNVNLDSFIKFELIPKHDLLLQSYKGRIPDSILRRKKINFDKFYGNEKSLVKYLNRLESEKSKRVMKGQKAENFTYFDVNDNEVMLSNFKGKYIYIDLWATWCGPCKKEFPYFEKLHKMYKNKNIVFLGISIDGQRDKGKWFDHINNNNIQTIQLFEGQNGKSEFVNLIKNNSIPRYLFINPEGKFISLDAPRPSNEKKVIRFLDSYLGK